MDQKSIPKIPCKVCKGSGFVKTHAELCKICNGIKCISCNECGYKVMPWSLCDICHGDGEVDQI